MADTAAAQHNDTTSGQLSISTTLDAMADAADAAAAAILVALPQPAAAAAGGSWLCCMHEYCEVPSPLTLCDGPMPCAHCCVGDSVVSAGAEPRRASNGEQLCELCPVRLSRAKGKLYTRAPGKICHTCYNRQQRAAAVASPAAAPGAPKQSRKRRAHSDPGESPEPRAPPALTRRVTPPKPAPATNKQHATRQEERIMRLLDETHARRMAAEKAAAAAAGGTAHQ